MKSATIEELLSWAFVHELPKGGGVEGLDNANSAWRMLEASSWGRMAEFAELLTLVDTGPRDSENFFIEQGAPHDDALEVGRAVQELASVDVLIPSDWFPLADWPGETRALAEASVADAVEQFSLRTRTRRAAGLVSIMVGVAVLGRAPDWSAPVPKIRMVERAGKPAWFMKRQVRDVFGNPYEIEVDGFNRRSGRPRRGAYRKYEFSVDPRGDILSRLDYQIWVAGLRFLEAKLCGKLVAHRVVPVDVSMTPWLERDRAGVGLAERWEGGRERVA